MKKFALINTLGILGAFMFATSAFAVTTASLSPASVTVATGKSFNVVVSVNPQGTNNLVEKLEIDYPADTLEATSFAFANTWMALPGAGYDSIDNINGVLIKTAGYPGGFSGATVFGTVTFNAKKSGSGTIKIGNNSLAFESNSQSAITGSDATFVITVPTVTPVTVPTVAPVAPKKASVQTEIIPDPSKTEQTTKVAPAEATVSTQETQTTSTSQTAAVAEAGSSGFAWLWVLLIVVALAGIGSWIYKRTSSKKV